MLPAPEEPLTNASFDDGRNVVAKGSETRQRQLKMQPCSRTQVFPIGESITQGLSPQESEYDATTCALKSRVGLYVSIIGPVVVPSTIDRPLLVQRELCTYK